MYKWLLKGFFFFSTECSRLDSQGSRTEWESGVGWVAGVERSGIIYRKPEARGSKTGKNSQGTGMTLTQIALTYAFPF